MTHDATGMTAVRHTAHKDEQRQCLNCNNHTKKPNNHVQAPLANPGREHGGRYLQCRDTDVLQSKRRAVESMRRTGNHRMVRVLANRLM